MVILCMILIWLIGIWISKLIGAFNNDEFVEKMSIIWPFLLSMVIFDTFMSFICSLWKSMTLAIEIHFGKSLYVLSPTALGRKLRKWVENEDENNEN